MKQINISIPDKNYNVYLGNSIFSKLPSKLKKENINGKLLLVIDSNVNKYYKQLIYDTFTDAKLAYKSIVITAKEKNKSFLTLQKIHTVLINNNFGRDSIIIAIGGGIIGDIAGFAASTYMRGIKYIQVPTTLLASVDSSVGGKTGINFNDTKNVIGTFYQPELVLIDSLFFKTLPHDELLCGLGEVVKYCFLTNKKFFDFVKNNLENILSNDTKTIHKIITESIIFKGSVVSADEKEAGIRKILNLGHTFAHAFEVESNHKLKHGQAVIVGITCALFLSDKLNLIEQKDFNISLQFLLLFSDRIKIKDVDRSILYKVMQRDKKNRDDEIKFVLLNSIGNLLTDFSAPKKIINESITSALKHFSL